MYIAPMKHFYLLAATILFSFSTFAQIQLGKNIDGESLYDESGSSVSLSSDGSIVAIGAPLNDDNGISSGQVRIYKYQTDTWTQLGKDMDGETEGDKSGYSLSMSSDGSILAIGAFGNKGNGFNSGHVRIYQYHSGTWTQLGKDIDGEAAGDQSGRVSLSSDGSIVAIGALGNDGNGNGSGHVRVYQYQSGTWAQLGKDIDGEAAGDYSGTFLSLSSDGSVVAIGAPENDGNGTSSGHVRIYKYQSGNWTQLGKDIDGEAAGDYCGVVSLSSDGSIVAIGAHRNVVNGDVSGHARVYKYQSGNWTQLGNDIDGESQADAFGYSVSISADGTILAIGAPGIDISGNNPGYVKFYRFQSGTWVLNGKKIVGEDTSDYCGSSLSISTDGSIVAIGAPGNSGNGTRSGHVRVYKMDGGNVGIPSIKSEFIIYPNPTSKELMIKVESNLLGSVYSIIGPIGQKVKEGNLTSLKSTIDVSALPKGNYLLKIGEANGTFKFQVQ